MHIFLQNKTMTGGFELPRAEPNGLAVHHLNLSVTSSDGVVVEIISDKIKMFLDVFVIICVVCFWIL